MKPLEIFFLLGTLLSMYWGYMSYRAAKGELEKLRRRRSHPRLLKEKALLERLHSSPSERSAYMIEGVLILAAGIGCLLMLSAIDFLPPVSQAFAAFGRWIGGGFAYLFALYRLGKCNAATTRYEPSIERLDRAIKEAEN